MFFKKVSITFGLVFILFACGEEVEDTVAEDSSSKPVSNSLLINQPQKNFELNVPDGMFMYSQNSISEKYGNGANRPSFVYGNKNATATIGISTNVQELAASELVYFQSATKQALLQTGVTWINDTQKQIGEYKVVELEFLSSSPTGTLYNKIVGFVDEGQLNLLTCNCLDSERSAWLSKFNAATESFRILKGL